MVILRVNGQDVYGKELNLLAATALAKHGLVLDTPEGDAQLQRIAGNLYDSLIRITIISQVAKEELEPASDEVIRERILQLQKSIGGPEQYEEFLANLNLTPEDSIEIQTNQERFERFQQQKMEEGRPQLNDDDIKNYYFAHEELFRFPQRARVSHILFAVNDPTQPEEWRLAKQRAEKVLEQLKPSDQEAFARAALEHSQDISSAPKGGDVGYVIRNQSSLPAELTEAVFEAEPGEIVGPVKTQYGFHLAMVTQSKMDYEEAIPSVRKLLESQSMAEHFNSWLDEQMEKAKIERVIEPLDYFLKEK